MTITDDMLRSAKSGNRRVGRIDLIKHLEGKRITQRQAIRAKCYDCNGMGELGECDITTCPLIQFSPYSQEKCVAKAIPGPQGDITAST